MSDVKAVTPQGLAFIRRQEGLRLQAYRDGGGVWTIGYGHTGTDVQEGLVITNEIANQLLTDDLARAILPFNKLNLLANFFPHQVDALASTAFNCGSLGVISAQWFKSLCLNDINAVPLWASWYCHDNAGHFQPGLAARRKAEARLFVFGSYGSDSP